MNEELEKLGKELEKEYGENLPSPIHEPIQFKHILKLYAYYKKKEENRG